MTFLNSIYIIGFLGKLTLKIPWHNLKSEPVIVKCDNVFAIATPSSQVFFFVLLTSLILFLHFLPYFSLS